MSRNQIIQLKSEFFHFKLTLILRSVNWNLLLLWLLRKQKYALLICFEFSCAASCVWEKVDISLWKIYVLLFRAYCFSKTYFIWKGCSPCIIWRCKSSFLRVNISVYLDSLSLMCMNTYKPGTDFEWSCLELYWRIQCSNVDLHRFLGQKWHRLSNTITVMGILVFLTAATWLG